MNARFVGRLLCRLGLTTVAASIWQHNHGAHRIATGIGEPDKNHRS